MKVICSGAPKTGTKTLSAALRILGYKVYDIEEQFFYIGHDLLKVMNDGWTPQEIRKIFEGVDAITDVPSCFLWEELHRAFPDAKIVHTERASDEEWGNSWVKQMHSIKHQRLARLFVVLLSPTGNRFRRFLYDCFRLQTSARESTPFYFRGINKQLSMLRYREHNSHVHAVAPKDKTLYFKLSDGWEPLCEFLGKPKPEIPFPHRNKGGSITQELLDKSFVFDQIKKEVLISVTLISVFLGLLFYFFW